MSKIPGYFEQLKERIADYFWLGTARLAEMEMPENPEYFEQLKIKIVGCFLLGTGMLAGASLGFAIGIDGEEKLHHALVAIFWNIVGGVVFYFFHANKRNKKTLKISNGLWIGAFILLYVASYYFGYVYSQIINE